ELWPGPDDASALGAPFVTYASRSATRVARSGGALGDGWAQALAGAPSHPTRPHRPTILLEFAWKRLMLPPPTSRPLPAACLPAGRVRRGAGQPRPSATRTWRRSEVRRERRGLAQRAAGRPSATSPRLGNAQSVSQHLRQFSEPAVVGHVVVRAGTVISRA